ncbi:MAG: hypothetical protein J4215_03020 [Candidatus Diapherotrites archaeon]|uniref:Uncharacterized protein n=1 Tax=Candidatus Iainarchaeum sp. TaxID=3101447 RepID=A0A8T4L7N0_9ARCH|nr:hypothetical protein [Candidatus Diapherotrites archaeon]
MDVVLWSLLGIVGVFGVGNAVLILTKPRRSSGDYAASMTVLQDPDVAAANLLAINHKIGLLNERVTRTETILSQIPLDALQQRFDLADFLRKIERLTEFRNNAEIEIVAMRDALVAKGILKPKVSSPELDREISARVFNSKPKSP